MLFLAASLSAGCASGGQRITEAQRQFMAGQEEAFAMLQRSGIDIVRVVGPFKRQALLWHKGMTLAQVILEAGYLEQSNPSRIIIQHGTTAETVDPAMLLRGEDKPVDSGDIVHVLP